MKCFFAKNFKLLNPYAILFFGTDFISVPVLAALTNDMNSKSNTAVVASLEVIAPFPEAPKKFLNQFSNLKFHAVSHKSSLKNWSVPSTSCTADGKYDIGVVVSFKYKLPAHVINAFRFGVINLHPSILPKYRGAAPIQNTLINGDKEGGVSIIKISPDSLMDAGDILKQVKVAVGPHIRHSELTEQLGLLGAKAILEVLNDFKNSWNNAKAQVGEISLAPKILEACFINFNEQNCLEIYNLWRGMENNGGIYSAFVPLNDSLPCRFRFESVLPLSEENFSSEVCKELALIDKSEVNVPAGSIYFPSFGDGSAFFIACSNVDCKSDISRWIGCMTYTISGKKAKCSAAVLLKTGFATGKVYSIHDESGGFFENEEENED